MIVWHDVVWQRSIVVMQGFVEEVKARAQLTGLVYTDGFEPYKHLDYGQAVHQVGKGKPQTYRVKQRRRLSCRRASLSSTNAAQNTLRYSFAQRFANAQRFAKSH